MKFLIKSLLVGSLFCVAAANADAEGASNNIPPIKKIPTGSSHQINDHPVPVSFMKVQSICPPDTRAKCPLVGSLVTLSVNVPCYAKLGLVSTRLIEQENRVRALAVSAVVYDDVQPG